MAGLLAVFADLMRSLHERAVRVWPTPGRPPNVWGDRSAPNQPSTETINPDESTGEAIGDWHYWVAQGYPF
jgi:hypothetical protein